MDAGKPRGRKAAKEETRQALIAAGIELFREAGVDQPSLDAICQRAGFTRGAFYVHFQDRTDFLIAVLDEALRQFIDSVISERGPGDVTTTIGLFLDAVAAMRAPEGHQRGTLSVVTHAMHHVPEVRERYAAVLKGTLARLASMASNDREAGAIRDDVGPEQVALILLAASVGLGTLLDVGVDMNIEGLREAALRIVKPLH